MAVLATGLELAPKDAGLLHNRKAVWSTWAQSLAGAGKEDEALAVVRKAVAAVLKAGKPRTPDLGGNATTVAVTEAVLAAL